MNKWEYAMLFMVQVPQQSCIQSKQQLLPYLSDRIQRLVIEWLNMPEPIDYLLYDFLELPFHFVPIQPTPLEITRAILHSDIYASWECAFLNEPEKINSQISQEAATELFEETTLEQYIIDGLLSDTLYE
ncbi:MAG: hypothetical protein ABL929_10465 [Ferruginibacter sp.]